MFINSCNQIMNNLVSTQEFYETIGFVIGLTEGIRRSKHEDYQNHIQRCLGIGIYSFIGGFSGAVLFKIWENQPRYIGYGSLVMLGSLISSRLYSNIQKKDSNNCNSVYDNLII